MALNITVDEVRQFCPDIPGSDFSIQNQIDVVVCQMEECLMTSYPNCLPIARRIAWNVICHFVFLEASPGQRTSRTLASGASESFDVYVKGGTGFNATRFGLAALQLDQEGCVNQVFSNKSRVFISTAGTSGSRRQPYRSGETLRDE